jgi:hypothetical protein
MCASIQTKHHDLASSQSITIGRRCLYFNIRTIYLYLGIESLTGRDSIDADSTVLFNLLWGNLGEVLWRNPGEVEKSESEKGMLFSFLFRL